MMLIVAYAALLVLAKVIIMDWISCGSWQYFIYKSGTLVISKYGIKWIPSR